MNRAKLYKSRRWLFKKFVVERLSQEEIAELAGTSQATIARWLEKHELTRRVS